MTTADDQKTITMMQLRSKPGTLLDYVFYRNESLLVEKAGEPRAVIVSLHDYEQLKQARLQARTRFVERAQQAQNAFQNLSEKEKQQLADEASAYARTTQST